MDSKNVIDIVKSIMPLIYFHSKEAYFPESLDYYIQHSSLYQGKKEVLNSVSLNQLANEYKGENLVLKNDLKTGSFERAEVYVRFQELETYFRIVFFVFFSYNGSLKVADCCCEVGEHSADVERFAFYLNKKTLFIEKVYLGAHGSKDGMWLGIDDLEKENGRFVLYSALSSHAFYNKPGRYWRYFGFLNDHTNKGVRWDPKFIIIDDTNPEWQKFQGNLGYPDNCQVPRYRGWENEPEISTTFWKRFFGC